MSNELTRTGQDILADRYQALGSMSVTSTNETGAIVTHMSESTYLTPKGWRRIHTGDGKDGRYVFDVTSEKDGTIDKISLREGSTRQDYTVFMAQRFGNGAIRVLQKRQNRGIPGMETRSESSIPVPGEAQAEEGPVRNFFASVHKLIRKAGLTPRHNPETVNREPWALPKRLGALVINFASDFRS